MRFYQIRPRRIPIASLIVKLTELLQAQCIGRALRIECTPRKLSRRFRDTDCFRQVPNAAKRIELLVEDRPELFVAFRHSESYQPSESWLTSATARFSAARGIACRSSVVTSELTKKLVPPLIRAGPAIVLPSLPF